MSAALVLIVIGGSMLEAVPGSGRVQVILLWALILLYEPLQVWRRGATVGHRRRNLQVVAANGGRLGLFRSIARFAIKALFGVLSFAPMLFTRRHQALQDLITRSHIVRDPLSAPHYHVVTERWGHDCRPVRHHVGGARRSRSRTCFFFSSSGS